MTEFRNLRVTVMGLGAFGGGEGVVRFLCDRGARVTVTDLKTDGQLASTLERLADCRLEQLHLGGHQERDFRDADLVVVNPAVPRSDPWLKFADESRVPLTSEMNLFVEHNRGRVLAVTGSMGKSTTSALAERMLSAGGFRTWLGGNIGRSLLPVVDDIGAESWVVLELSSFQLSDLTRLRFRPEVAVVTNLRPNHLDWHRSLGNYRAAKQEILRWQRTEDLAVLNADDPDVAGWPVSGRTEWFGAAPHSAPARDPSIVPAAAPVPRDGGRRLFAEVDGSMLRLALPSGTLEMDLASDFPLVGNHHAMNLAAAAAATAALGVGEQAIREAVRSFRGLPHRLEFVGEFRGRRFFDDSKATTPEAAIAALEAFEQPVVLLAGGADKHVDLGDFARRICERVKGVALLGETAPVLAGLIDEHLARARRPGASPHPAIACPGSLAEAVTWAIDQTAVGDVVLLSPGCASYGWFANYVERGFAFRERVRAWAEG